MPEVVVGTDGKRYPARAAPRPEFHPAGSVLLLSPALRDKILARPLGGMDDLTDAERQELSAFVCVHRYIGDGPPEHAEMHFVVAGLGALWMFGEDRSEAVARISEMTSEDFEWHDAVIEGACSLLRSSKRSWKVPLDLPPLPASRGGRKPGPRVSRWRTTGLRALHRELEVFEIYSMAVAGAYLNWLEAAHA